MSSIVINLLGKNEPVTLLLFNLWLLVSLLFLLVSLIGYDLWLWLFLDIFFTIMKTSPFNIMTLFMTANRKVSDEKNVIFLLFLLETEIVGTR